MILTGLARLGRDAQLRFTPPGEPVCNLALAFSHGKKDSAGNRATQWVEAALWGKQAESLVNYLTKGTQLYVVIRDPVISTYAKTEGGQGVKLAGSIISLEFAGSRAESKTNLVPGASNPPNNAQSTNYNEFDDDIPF